MSVGWVTTNMLMRWSDWSGSALLAGRPPLRERGRDGVMRRTMVDERWQVSLKRVGKYDEIHEDI